MRTSIDTALEQGDERQADWIFLLPLSKECTVLQLGASFGHAATALAKRCKTVTVVDPDLLLTTILPDHGFDIIAVPEPVPNLDIKGIHARLKKGGTIYMAVKNQWKIKKQLAHTGFSEIMAYAVLPSPKMPLFFLPLDSGGAIRYFFRKISYLLSTASVESKRRYRIRYFFVTSLIPWIPSFFLAPLIRWFSPYIALIAKK